MCETMKKSLIARWPCAVRAMAVGMATLAVALWAACGLHPYPGTLGTGGQATETGGQSGGTGGQATGSGGQTGGSGGESSGAGGQTKGGGGGSPGNGGETYGNGGRRTDAGGQSGGSGGETAGAGGQAGGSAGRTTSTGGGSGSGGGSAATGGGTGTGGTTSGRGGSGSGGISGTGGATNSTVGVTINGKFVPKEKAVVFIHFGHSNMRGQATTPTSLKSYFYNTEDGLWSYRGSYALAKEPTAPEGSYTYAGPGMAILHSARAAVASGSDVQFISIGYGVGSKTSVDFQKSGSYYPIFMNWAGQLKGKVTFAGIVVMLGITERHLASDQIPGFPDRMAQLISDIRSDLGEPNLPVLFCDYEQGATGDLAPTGAIGSVIMPLVRQMPSKISKLVLVPTDNLEMQDDHHFDMQGQKDWAARVISQMQANNWFPWK
jgi:hypothetical protein